MFYWTPKRIRELKEKGLKLTYEDKNKEKKTNNHNTTRIRPTITRLEY